MILEYIVYCILVIFVMTCFSLAFLTIDFDYYKTINGIKYHCYDGSDYLICDEVGDGIGYD